MLEEFCISDPTTIELEDLAAAKNGFVQYQPMQGAQGRILLDRKRAIITVDSGIRDPKRRRFVLAHELGHLILHVNAQQQLFNCDIDAFLDWQGRRPEEGHANIFAANLLMPPMLFGAYFERKKFSIANLQSASDRFMTSLMSTSIQFTQHGNYPIAVVFSIGGTVRWAAMSNDFPNSERPLHWIPYMSPVPPGSVAHDVFASGKAPKEAAFVDSAEWFAEDYNLRFHEDLDLYEVCHYYSTFNGVLSYIYGK
ncbi:MAG TPA: ImmA/IrrE family metallo-endopeptidase [Flavobacteriales bacterium]|nr:ImmA/IrrE family metallo-endopeptidase [Flavobacteriales bacterium]HMR28241.1 ImmA/IrrE family metallo-endopeptidase [Flavobacteriales bacterium]